jgi:hypothetical protein
MFDGECMKSVTEAFSEEKSPFKADYPFYVLIETSGSVDEHDREVKNICYSLYHNFL